MEKSHHDPSLNQFIRKLNYLGGNLGISKRLKEFVDLELFFVECAYHFESDQRVKQTILNWAYQYAFFLSPSKIRRILKIKNQEPKFLSTLVSFLRCEDRVKSNWDILLDEKPVSKIKFKENAKKYLKTKSFVLNNTPEIRYRIEGRNQVTADILSFVEKSEFSSLYELAKKIHSPRNRVNECFKILESFQVISRRS